MNKADLIRFFIWNYKFGFIYEVTYKTRATYKYCRLPLLLSIYPRITTSWSVSRPSELPFRSSSHSDR